MPPAPITPVDLGSAAEPLLSEIPAAPVTPPEDELRPLAPLIRAKVEPPELRPSTLTRRRLIESLSKAVQQRVTLLIAEAGYGKTTLLTDFARHASTRSTWYRLDQTDQDWITWVNYLIAAVAQLEPSFGRRTSHMLSADPTAIVPRDAVIASLIGELQDIDDPSFMLFLDDFHLVDESAEACEVVARLIRDAPRGLRIVISSRRRPPLLVARLASMGQLDEIVTDDLRFSLQETEELFAVGYGQPLERDVLLEVDARTRGWAATLQLVGSSISGRTQSAVRSLVHSISGGEGRLYDFLAEEVLGRLPEPLQAVVTRAAMLVHILPEYVVALFEGSDQPTEAVAARWIEEADVLGIVSRSSQMSQTREFHPLFRDFLFRRLERSHSPDELRLMHARVARVATSVDPLVACHHFIEAGDPDQAMRWLGKSAMLTIGSGRWGTASELISRLQDVPTDPVVAAIQARRLLEDGDVTTAATLLNGIDLDGQPPAARAVVRHTRLSLGWRSRDSAALFATLRDIEEDRETPHLLREIAQVFVDASPLSPNPVPFPALSQRLQRMADRQTRAGHSYHAAISLHNAAIAELNAGRISEAIRVGERAVEAFGHLAFPVADRFSTLPVLAACHLEMGRLESAEARIRESLASGGEEGDVHSSCAHSLAMIGEVERCTRLLLSAEVLERQGRSDLQGAAITQMTRAFLQLPHNPRAAFSILRAIDTDGPLDLGFNLERYTLLATSHLLSDDESQAREIASRGLEDARRRGGLRAEVRLSMLLALAEGDALALRAAVSHAASVGDLGLLEVADAIGRNLHLTPDIPDELSDSIRRWRGRWLPVLRAQLGRGNTPSAHIAARLLDEHGALDDVARLRAFDRTYIKRGRGAGLGRGLVRRVSDKLLVQDLGRVTLEIGDRQVALSKVRRKAAALLMFLVTKPNFTATREQVVDELWPDADPMSGQNSLNQSLYFLRRDIDPWYEDDISADYVAYQGELLWLDPELVEVHSARFLSLARPQLASLRDGAGALRVLDTYAGQFSPEFEYEEWAMSWRSRVHASFLDFAHGAIGRLIELGDLQGARDVAARALSVDPAASDIEQRLIWLYWRLGVRSAAVAQYQHLSAQSLSDGIEPPTLEALVSASGPYVNQDH